MVKGLGLESAWAAVQILPSPPWDGPASEPWEGHLRSLSLSSRTLNEGPPAQPVAGAPEPAATAMSGFGAAGPRTSGASQGRLCNLKQRLVCTLGGGPC